MPRYININIDCKQCGGRFVVPVDMDFKDFYFVFECPFCHEFINTKGEKENERK